MNIKHFVSKLALVIYLLAFVGLSVWAYMIFKDRSVKVSTAPLQTLDDSSSLDAIDNLANDNDTDGNNTDEPANESLGTETPIGDAGEPVSPIPNISGSMLANITPEHCDNSCQAFAIDLSLREYCEQACGISPIKNVSSCDDKKGIQRDYCFKDLAINKADLAQCDKVEDANIKQACKNRITQDIIENL